jgi:AraC-like DNA-binding protein
MDACNPPAPACACASTAGDRPYGARARRTAGDLSQPVRRALAHVLACYAQRLTLAELAAVSAQTPFTLIRAFRRELGITPHACLVQVRVLAATRMMEAGRPIAAAAADAGFVDQAHLTRHFKRFHGDTPARFLSAARGTRAAAAHAA